MNPNRELLWSHSNDSLSSLRADLINMQKKGVCSDSEFLEKHKHTGLDRDVLQIFWNVTRLGYPSYELPRQNMSAEQLRALQDVGFHIMVCSAKDNAVLVRIILY